MENYYCYNKNMNVIERVLIYDISILCCISTLFTPSICHSATLPTSLSLVVSVDYPIRIHFDHFIHYILVSLFPFRSIHICSALITSLCRESDERQLSSCKHSELYDKQTLLSSSSFSSVLVEFSFVHI